MAVYSLHVDVLCVQGLSHMNTKQIQKLLKTHKTKTQSVKYD